MSEGDAEKSKAARSDFEKLASDYPYAGDLASERALIELADERLLNAS